MFRVCFSHELDYEFPEGVGLTDKPYFAYLPALSS